MQVLDKSVVVQIEWLFIVMRELGAVFGAHLIDRTFIIYQELAGLKFVYPVAVLFFLQPFIDEFFRLHTQVGRNARDICTSEGWCHGLAAVGATHAIHLFPHAGIGFRYQFRHVFRHYIVQLVQKGRQFTLFAGRHHAETFQIHREM